MKSVFRLRINGAAVEVLALVHKTLLEVLCEDLQLTGTKHGRELGECGTCTVLLDGVPTLLCLLLPIEVQEHEIVTIEGMALGSTLHALQNTFSELGAAQCGYCTPGMLLTALALLCTNPAPARQQIKEALAGNLCRCTGYIKIFEAVDLAAQRLLADCIPSAGEAMASTYSIIGQRVPARVDGTGKVTGVTRYTDDLFLPRMLYGKLLRSPQPHARIVRLETSKAAALPGVLAVITGADLPQPYSIMPVNQDEHALASDKVRYVGDPVVAVAAVDEATAETALHHIEVTYEPLRPLMSMADALAYPEDRIHDYNRVGNVHRVVALEFGAVEAGFHEAEYIREDTFFFQGNTHLPMEQHAAVAQYTPDGHLTLWSATQTPHYVHRALATVLGLAAGRVRVIATPVGGGFGGKSDMFAHEFCAAKLSMLTGRPVKICLTREEVFYAHRGRHPVLMWVRTGVKRDGAITAMHFKTFVDGGGYSSYGVASVLYTGALQTVTYKITHYRFEGLRVFTNKPPLIESLDPEGPYGAKEAGQGPLLPVLPALANAVYDALGVRIDEIPITPEKILKALDLRERGREPRVGPQGVPAFAFPPPRQVERPEEWLQVVPAPHTRRP